MCVRACVRAGVRACVRVVCACGVCVRACVCVGVCQVSTEGTGSRGQTGHSDNGQTCADFTVTSDNRDSSLTHPNLERCRHLRGHSGYTVWIP